MLWCRLKIAIRKPLRVVRVQALFRFQYFFGGVGERFIFIRLTPGMLPPLQTSRCQIIYAGRGYIFWFLFHSIAVAVKCVFIKVLCRNSHFADFCILNERFRFTTCRTSRRRSRICTCHAFSGTCF